MAGMLAAPAVGVAGPPSPGNRKFRVIVRAIWRRAHEGDPLVGAFMEPLSRALAAMGFKEGVNLELVRHYLSDVTPEVRRRYLDQLGEEGVDAIIVTGDEEAKLARRATRKTPIIAWDVHDPVKAGVAESFVRPGGNVTGLTYGRSHLFVKQVQFLLMLMPKLTGVAGFIAQRQFSAAMNNSLEGQFEEAARDSGLRHRKFVSSPQALAAMGGLRSEGFQAIIYVGMALPPGARRHADQALNHGIATMGGFDSQARVGMLASYGEHVSDLVQRLAQLTAHILRGGNPAETPFMEPMRMRLTINGATARALGLELSPELKILADEVIP